MVIQILEWDRDRDRVKKGGFKSKLGLNWWKSLKLNACFEVIGIGIWIWIWKLGLKEI